jgi:hypothetical protein
MSHRQPNRSKPISANAAAIQAVFAGVDCVFHVVAPLRIMFSIAHPLLAHLTDFVGTPKGCYSR